MAISITPGTQYMVPGNQNIDTMSQSTATAAQTISVTQYISVLGAGTATGTNSVNVYTLPAGPDGTEKLIYLAATGEATLRMTMATGQHVFGRDLANVASATNVACAFIGAATGAFVFNAKARWLKLLCLDEGWTVMGGNATIATAT